MKKQNTLDNTPFPKVIRKRACNWCKAKTKYMFFCSEFCKNAFNNYSAKYLSGESINKDMRLGNVFNSEFDNLPKLAEGDTLRITKTEFGTTPKNDYPYVIITDENRGQIFSTASAVVSILARDDEKKAIAEGSVIETTAKIQTFTKTGRKGLGLDL